MINGTLCCCWGNAGCRAAVLFPPAYRKSTFGYRARKAELRFVSCLWNLPFFSLVLFVLFFLLNPKQALKLLAPASRAGPGSSRASTERWSGQDSAGGAELPLVVWHWCLGQWDKKVCSSHLLVKHPQFSKQLCSNLSSGRHRNVLTMTFFVLLVFFSSQPFFYESCCILAAVNLGVH